MFFHTLKKLIIPALCNAALLLLGPSPAHAQESSASETPASETLPGSSSTALTLINQERTLRTQRAMGVLGGWALANIGVGTAGFLATEGKTKAFHEMNLGWNLVNLAIAIPSFLNARNEDPSSLNGLESLQKAYWFERVFLINIGLNISYMAGGLYLRERALRLNNHRQQGWGNSLLLQGGFLLAFDTTLFFLQRHRTNELVNSLTMGPIADESTRGLTLRGRF